MAAGPCLGWTQPCPALGRPVPDADTQPEAHPLVVSVKPIEQAEDSGVPQEAGQGLVIPLLDGREG